MQLSNLTFMIDKVLVCNRSGFIGTEVVKQLLEKGYTVRATVRSTSNKEKVAHLLALGNALPGESTSTALTFVCLYKHGVLHD